MDSSLNREANINQLSRHGINDVESLNINYLTFFRGK